MALFTSLFVGCGASASDDTDDGTTIEDTDSSDDSGDTDDADESDDSDDTVDQEGDYDEDDYNWDTSEAIAIVLDGDTITADTDGVTVDGSELTILSAGTYHVSGELTDGRIVVDTDDEDTVKLIFDGVTIHCSYNAPFFVAEAEHTAIILAAGSENYLSDGDEYTYADAEEDEPNAALHSKDYLTIGGSGSLTVTGNYNDGITGKDGLLINSGTISVTAVDDGIRGKDYLIVNDGDITVNADGDGLKSDNDEDADKGYIYIENGSFDITADNDGIQAVTDIYIDDGDFTLTTGGGSANSVDESTTQKGLKAGGEVNIDGGSFTISSADDAVHSNDAIVINGGIFDISSGDDGMHADASLEIHDGQISITKSYEGIESLEIFIDGGDITISSEDDAIKSDYWIEISGGLIDIEDSVEGIEAPNIIINDGEIHINSSDDGMNATQGSDVEGDDGSELTIYGGYVDLSASAGDGIDSNGSLTIAGGTVIVHGAPNQPEVGVDINGDFVISGGYVVIAQVNSAGMVETPSSSTSQNTVLLSTGSQSGHGPGSSNTLSAGTLFHIEDTSGSTLVTFAPEHNYSSILFSSPNLTNGNSYRVYTGGSCSGTEADGLYTGGTFSGGTLRTTFTSSGTVQTVSF